MSIGPARAELPEANGIRLPPGLALQLGVHCPNLTDEASFVVRHELGKQRATSSEIVGWVSVHAQLCIEPLCVCVQLLFADEPCVDQQDLVVDDTDTQDEVRGDWQSNGVGGGDALADVHDRGLVQAPRVTADNSAIAAADEFTIPRMDPHRSR